MKPKSEIKDRLHIALRIKNVTAKELCDKTGIPKSSISQYMSGYAKPKQDRIYLISTALNINPAWLLGYDVDMDDTSTNDEKIYQQLDMTYIKVPLYGDISCGNGAFVDDNILDYIAVPDDGLNPNLEYFAQIAKGDSMIEVGIEEGDIIIFQKSNTIEDGKIGAFCIDEGIATCKKIKKGKTFIQLIPANTKYDPIVIDLQDSNFRVIGILKKAIKSYE